MRKPTFECVRGTTPISALPSPNAPHLHFWQETLTRHKPMVAEYLDENYDRVSAVLGAL